jgi:hypothetical protein
VDRAVPAAQPPSWIRRPCLPGSPFAASGSFPQAKGWRSQPRLGNITAIAVVSAPLLAGCLGSDDSKELSAHGRKCE